MSKKNDMKKSDEKEEVKETAEECSEDGIVEEKSEIDILKAQTKDLENDLNEWKTKYYKVFADMENMKKRMQTEHQNSLKYMMQDFATDLLPIVDNLERALNVNEPSDEITNFLKGFEMISKQFLDALSKNGIDAIEALNKEFDPNFHQAVMTSNEEDVEDNIIVEELQKGYKINGRVLRASLVKVNQK